MAAAMQDPSWTEMGEPPRPRGGLGLACCTSRPKPGKVEMPAPKGESGPPIWDTADLSWWDFQRRRWRTLWLMRTVYYRYKKLQGDTESMPEGPVQDALWEEVHKLSSKEMRMHAEDCKGLFIKVGQAMSAMVGQLPDCYTNEFLLLTDHLPVSTIEEVYGTIQRSFKMPPKDVFSEFDPEPLASASIAQVHRARLRHSGEIVAVKVQHEGVDRIFTEDISTLSTVAGQVAFWSPDLDFRKFADEWAESLPHELDFTHERGAIKRAGDALRNAGNACIVPTVHSKYFGKHVFVMEFIDAGPFLDLADAEFCKRNNISKHEVLTSLLDAFGIMAFKDGMFHADPHAGNVRLKLDTSAPGGARPVLLDWGLFRVITDDERLGLAKVFHSLANFDMAGLFDVLESLGFALKDEAKTDQFKRDLLDKCRGVMKDTISRDQTRADAKEALKEYKARLDRAAQQNDEAQGSYSPIYFLEDWPSCIIFFMRMLQIVRGLCVAVDADGMPILQIFARHAKEALQEGSRQLMISNRLRMFQGRDGRPNLPETPRAVSPTSVELARNEGLEEVVQQALAKLLEAKKIVGAQVAIIQGSRLICEVAAGTLSSIDARPVEKDTRFPLLGATPGIAALAFLRALRRQSKELLAEGLSPADLLKKTLVRQIWPKFGGGTSQVTLAQLLSHSAGLQDAYPKEFHQSTLDDVAGVAAHLEQDVLSVARETRYAYLVQAFAMAKLGDCLAGQDDVLHWLGLELGPLGLDAAQPMGRGREASICRDLPHLARVSMSEVQSARARRLQAESSPVAPGAEFGGSSGSTAGAPASQAEEERKASTLLQAIANDPLVFDPLQGNAPQGGLFRAGLSLGASARGLAEMFSSQELQADLEELQALELAGQDKTAVGWLLTGGASQWTTGGLQALELRPSGAKALLGHRQGGYGVVCGFGPIVAHFPDLAPGGVTLAVLVNDVLHGRQAVTELLQAALQGFGVVPTWPSMTMSVMADAHKLAHSPEAAPLVDKVGGIEGLKKMLDLSVAAEAPAGKSSPEARGRCGGCGEGVTKVRAALVARLGGCCGHG
eukprot:TRINITY_DN22555_c0_g1_i1.p1 TRINITY_DN22555_c0_g1~~TRINITY_DN22555_c0_g1_i1.p1  ORF type:complete len:1072 (+),score=218.92 TRINITY_DN22555_c0_g1_i1:23-3217(+)